MLNNSVLVRLNNGMALDILDVPVFETLKKTVYQNKEVAVAIDRIIAEFASGIVSNAADAGVSQLTRFKKDIERRLIEQIRDWSVPFALTLFRSILALNRVAEFGPHEFARSVRIMDLAICRYCRYGMDDIITDGEGIWGIRIAEPDVRAMLEASNLVQLVGMCQVGLRRLAYGGTLVGTGSGWEVVLEEPVQKLSEVHDRRLALYGNLFRHAGIPGEDTLPLGRGRCWILLAGKNEDRWLWSERLKDHIPGPDAAAEPLASVDDTYVPTFMLGEFSLDSYTKTLEIFEAAMAMNGFSLDVALALLRTIADIGNERYCEVRPGHRLRSFGFTIVPRNYVVQRVMSELRAADREASVQVVDCAIRYIARSAGEASRVSFNDPTGLRSLVTLNDDHLLVDYSTSFSAVRRLFDIVGGVKGVDANVRGASFEHYVTARLVNSIPSAAKLWVSRRLTFVDGEVREADVGVTIGDLLVLCECKARPQRMRDDGITATLVAGLSAQQQGDLRQVDGLARLLSSKALRGPGPLAKSVKRILPCVVTTSVDWIDSTDPRMWIIPNIVPRVCTVEELIDALGGGPAAVGKPLNNEMSVNVV